MTSSRNPAGPWAGSPPLASSKETQFSQEKSLNPNLKRFFARSMRLSRIEKRLIHHPSPFELRKEHAKSPSIIGEDSAGADRHGMFSPEKPKVVVLNHPEHGEMDTLTEMMGHTVAFARIEEVLRARGQIVDGTIGQARCQMMKGEELLAATVEILR